MIEGLFKRLVDGVLMCVVWFVSLDDYFYITHDWDMRDKILKAEFSDGLKMCIVISLMIGVVLKICRSMELLCTKEIEDTSKGAKPKRTIDGLLFRFLLLVGIFFGSSALRGWLVSASGMSRETRHSIEFVKIIVIALILQIVLMGSKCVIGGLVSMVFETVCYVAGFVIGIILILGRRLMDGAVCLREFLGERIMLGLLQLALCIIGTLLVFGICLKTGIEQDYEKGLSEFIYCAKDYFKVGCMLASVLLILMGQGVVGRLFRRLFGWNSGALESYDRRHGEHLIRLSNGDYMWGNNNPHGILGLVFFCMAVATGMVGGFFMPVIIAGNFIIGIIQLIVRVLSNKIEAKES